MTFNLDASNGAKGHPMKSKLAIAGLILGALLVPAAGFAADDTDKNRDQPKTFVKDSATTTRIKAKLAAEHFGSLAKIHVDTTSKGIVTLTGTAGSQEEVDKAVAIARGTEHVRGVKNRLKIKKDA